MEAEQEAYERAPAPAGARAQSRRRAVPAADASGSGRSTWPEPGRARVPARRRVPSRAAPSPRDRDRRPRPRPRPSPRAPGGPGLLGGRDGLVPDDPRAVRDRPPRSSAAAPDRRRPRGHAPPLRGHARRRTAAGGCIPRPRATSSSRRSSTSRCGCSASPADEPLTSKARALAPRAAGRRARRSRPGASSGSPLLGLYDYRGRQSRARPSSSSCPRWLPVHPGATTATRATSISAMATSTAGASAPISARSRPSCATSSMRRPYARVDFAAHRHDVAATDLYVAPGARAARRPRATSLALYERVAPAALPPARARALPRAHPLRAAASRLPGALPGERAAELPRPLGARPGASRARAEPRRAWRRGAGRTRGGRALRGRAVDTPGTRRSRCSAPRRGPSAPRRGTRSGARLRASSRCAQLTEELPDRRGRRIAIRSAAAGASPTARTAGR